MKAGVKFLHITALLAECAVLFVLLLRPFSRDGKLYFTRLPSATDRENGFGAVKVFFDAAGGTCYDPLRIVKKDGVYGASMNLYPSEDRRYFRNLAGAHLDASHGRLEAEHDNASADNHFVNYFTTNAVASISAGELWTYVVDVESLEGQIAGWRVGQSLPTNLNVYAQLSHVDLGAKLKSGDKRFLVMKGMDWPSFNMLDRAFLIVAPGRHLKIRFRISLFAGTAVNQRTYRYVAPGETLACPLPTPVRKGFAFKGWYDGDVLITAETPVAHGEPHTLTAKWQKNEG